MDLVGVVLLLLSLLVISYTKDLHEKLKFNLKTPVGISSLISHKNIVFHNLSVDCGRTNGSLIPLPEVDAGVSNSHVTNTCLHVVCEAFV